MEIEAAMNTLTMTSPPVADTTQRKKSMPGAVSHHERELAELRADRALAVEYLKAAMASLDDPDDRAAGLLALRTVAEAYGGLAAVAADAGISREALYRALSPKGNPTLKTLLAVLKTVGMRLSVESEPKTCATP
jgi:probable addiction module antidote protein